MRKCKKAEIEELKKNGMWSTWDSILNNLYIFFIIAIVLLIWFIIEYESRHQVIRYFWSRIM